MPLHVKVDGASSADDDGQMRRPFTKGLAVKAMNTSAPSSVRGVAR